MTNLTSHGILAAAELPFYSISLLLSVFICAKQRNFTKNAGWLYLILLSLLRIIGSSCILYMQTHSTYSPDLIETAAITSAVGTAPLLLVLMGLLTRLHATMDVDKSFSQHIFRPLHLASLLGLILAITGGTDESSSSSSTQKTGKTLMEVAACIFLGIFFALGMISVLTYLRRRYIPSTEQKLMLVSICALPFLLVRVLYTVIVAFSHDRGSVFYYRDVNVWVQAFMMFLMEVIVVAMYIWAGLLTPRQEVEGGLARRVAVDEEEVELQHRERDDSARQKRSLGDYRPSRLVMNAIRERS